RIEDFEVRYTANALESFIDNPKLANLNPALYIYNENITAVSYANAVGERTFNIRNQRQKNITDAEGFYGKGIWRTSALDEARAVLSQYVTEDTVSSVQSLLAGYKNEQIEYIRIAQSAEKVRYEASGFILRFGGPVVEMFLGQSFQKFLRSRIVHWTEKLGMLFSFDFYFNKNWIAVANSLIFFLTFFTSFNAFVYIICAWLAVLIGLVSSQAINAQTLVTMEEENKHPILAFWKDFAVLFFYYTSFVPEHHLQVKQGTQGLGVFTITPRTSDLERKDFTQIFKTFKFGIGMGILATSMILLGPFHPVSWAVNIYFVAMAFGWWITPFMMNPVIPAKQAWTEISKIAPSLISKKLFTKDLWVELNNGLKKLLWHTWAGNVLQSLLSWVTFPIYIFTFICYLIEIRRVNNFINRTFALDVEKLEKLSEQTTDNNLKNMYTRLAKFKTEFPSKVVQKVKNMLLANEPGYKKSLENAILPWKVFADDKALKARVAQAFVMISVDYLEKNESLKKSEARIDQTSNITAEPEITGIGSDYDKTLSEGSIENNPGMIEKIIGLLKHKVHFAVMSGSNVNTQMKRVLGPLLAEFEKQGLSLAQQQEIIKYFTLYGNGVGSKYGFELEDINGKTEVKVYLDKDYTRKNGIDIDDIAVIKTEADRIIKDYIGNDPAGYARADIRDEMSKTPLPGGKGVYGARKAPEFEERGSWVEQNGTRVYDTKVGDAEFLPTLLAINNIFFKNIADYRKQLDKYLADHGLADKYETRHGGGDTGFTIEIFRKGLEKDVAMRDFIDSKGLTPENTGYFGDEFYPGGNDWRFLTTTDPKVQKIKIFAVNTADAPAPADVQKKFHVYKEGGPASTKKLFQEIIDDHDKKAPSANKQTVNDPQLIEKGEEIFKRMLKEVLTGEDLPVKENLANISEEKNSFSRQDEDSEFLPITAWHEFIDKAEDNKKDEITVLFDKGDLLAYKFSLNSLKIDDTVTEEQLNGLADYLAICIYNRLVVIGAVKVLINAPERLYQKIENSFNQRFNSEQMKAENKSISGYLSFVNAKPFEFKAGSRQEIDAISAKADFSFDAKSVPAVISGNLVGIDLGGTAIKTVAISNGKKVKEIALPWSPQQITDPQEHINLVKKAIETVSEGLKNIDAIGVSWAGVVANGNIAAGGPITAKLSKDQVNWLKENFNQRISAEFADCLVYVSNDGDSGVFGAAAGLNISNAIGFGMGTGLAFSYVDKKGNLNNHILGEGGNVVIDLNPNASGHTYTGVHGVLQKYLSQWAVVEQAQRMGIKEIEDVDFQQKAKVIGELLEANDPRAVKIFKNIGRYLAVAIAEYYRYFKMENVVIFGGVTMGKSGEVIQQTARQILEKEFPEVKTKIWITLDQQYGGAIGAAYLANKQRHLTEPDDPNQGDYNQVIKIRQEMNKLVKENDISSLEQIILNEDQKPDKEKNWKRLTESVAARNKLGEPENERIKTVYQANLLWCPENQGRRDLHFHSRFSDGRKEIEDIIKEAVGKVIKVIALSDHNNIAGVEEIKQIAKLYGVEVIPCVEIAAFKDFHGNEGEVGAEIHFLAYGVDQSNQKLIALLKKINSLFLFKWMSNVYDLLILDNEKISKTELIEKLKDLYARYIQENIKIYEVNNLTMKADEIKAELALIDDADWQNLFILLKSDRTAAGNEIISDNFDLLKKFVVGDVQYQNAFEEFRKQMEAKLKDKGADIKESRYGVWNRENKFLPQLPLAEEVIDIIHDAGGLAVFAHPRWYTEIVMPQEDISEIEAIEFIKNFIEDLAGKGLDGLEVYTHWVDDRDNFWQEVAEKNKLLVSGGTDSHFMGKEIFGEGSNNNFYLKNEDLERLIKRIIKNM
ncbi:MAG: ROK family protein, partial [Candidatus Omnitrophica bacterium]|nr:ROK family protein [Candidatus Omnitrophota bacterium]